MREIKKVSFDEWFQKVMEDIDVASNDKSEPNSVSMTQIMDAYEESKEEQ